MINRTFKSFLTEKYGQYCIEAKTSTAGRKEVIEWVTEGVEKLSRDLISKGIKKLVLTEEVTKGKGMADESSSPPEAIEMADNDMEDLIQEILDVNTEDENNEETEDEGGESEETDGIED